MEREEIIKNVNYIEEVIHSSNRYTNVSGIAGIISGALALIGCFLSYSILSSWNVMSGPVKNEKNIIMLIAIWLAVFVLAGAAQIILTIYKARRMEILPWTKLSRQVIFALVPALLAGALLTLYLIDRGQIEYIPGVWILLYGVGIAASGMFSVIAVRVLGWAFILTAIIPLFILPEYGILFLGLTFGIYHIIYGIVVAVKYKG